MKGFFITLMMVLTLAIGPVTNAFSHTGNSILLEAHTLATEKLSNSNSAKEISNIFCAENCQSQRSVSDEGDSHFSECSHSCSAILNNSPEFISSTDLPYLNSIASYIYLPIHSNERPPRTAP